MFGIFLCPEGQRGAIKRQECDLDVLGAARDQALVTVIIRCVSENTVRGQILRKSTKFPSKLILASQTFQIRDYWCSSVS